MSLPTVAICGLSLEVSTFSPARTTLADLGPYRGSDLLQLRPFWRPGGSLADAARWRPIAFGRSIPGGQIPLDDYCSLRDEICLGLRDLAVDLDGVVLDLHGAASVVGLDDAEADLAEGVRGAVGPDVLVTSGMDLHGNVSERLVRAVALRGHPRREARLFGAGVA